jgi:predicted kinase
VTPFGQAMGLGLRLRSSLSLLRARAGLRLFRLQRRFARGALPGTKAILLVGVPGSGKSTVAQTRYPPPHFEIHSTDSIRAELFGDEATQGPWSLIELLLRWRIVQTVRAQRVAVVDATHAQQSHRLAAIGWLRSVGVERVLALHVATPLATCRERNRSRARVVPDQVLTNMHRSLEAAPPSVDEGFDGVEVVV